MNAGLIKSVTFRDDDDEDHFERSLHEAFPIMRGKAFAMLQPATDNRTLLVIPPNKTDDGSDQRWNLARLRT